MRKNCSSDREKLLKFEAESREFSKFLKSLEHFFLTVGQNNFGNKIPFLKILFDPYAIYLLPLWCKRILLLLNLAFMIHAYEKYGHGY